MDDIAVADEDDDMPEPDELPEAILGKLATRMLSE